MCKKKYNELESLKKEQDNIEENKNCDKRREKSVVVFPAVPLKGDGTDPTDCLVTNRDAIVDAFCWFRNQFDDSMRSYNIYDKDGVSGTKLWPKMCCAQKGDCKRPGIKAEEMRPFVLAQGGTLSVDSMRSEIFDMLGRHGNDGILLEGMRRTLHKLKQLDHISTMDANNLLKKMQVFFKSIDMCGPIVFESPDSEENNMCELFYSYPHLMKSFYEQLKTALVDHSKANQQRRKLLARDQNMNKKLLRHQLQASPVPDPPKSWKEWMKQQFFVYDETIHNFQKEIAEVQASKQAQNYASLVGEVQQLKKELKTVKAENKGFAGLKEQLKVLSPSRNTSCLPSIEGLAFSPERLDEYKNAFCREYGLDLSNPRVVNVAMIYLGDKFVRQSDESGTDEQFRRRLQKKIRYSITDQCKYDKMFQPGDISLQKLKSADHPEKTEWAFLIKLDWANKKGYLSSQLQDSQDDNKCRSKRYLPYTEIGIQAYEDTSSCCMDSKDYWACRAQGCHLAPLEHHWKVGSGGNLQAMAFKMTVTGTVFDWEHHEFYVEGTQYTNEITDNYLSLGKNVNDKIPGDRVEAQLGKQRGTLALLEEGNDERHKRYNAFMQHAVSSDTSITATELFEGVEWDEKLMKFKFRCEDSKSLCKELTKRSQSLEEMVFSHNGDTFGLVGDGQFVYYNFCDSGLGDNCNLEKKRRRLLQRRSRGC